MWDNLEYTQTSTGYLNEIIGVYITNGNTKISYINKAFYNYNRQN